MWDIFFQINRLFVKHIGVFILGKFHPCKKNLQKSYKKIGWKNYLKRYFEEKKDFNKMNPSERN